MCWLVAVGTFMEEYKVLRQQKVFQIDYQVCNISTMPLKWSFRAYEWQREVIFSYGKVC